VRFDDYGHEISWVTVPIMDILNAESFKQYALTGHAYSRIMNPDPYHKECECEQDWEDYIKERKLRKLKELQGTT